MAVTNYYILPRRLSGRLVVRHYFIVFPAPLRPLYFLRAPVFVCGSVFGRSWQRVTRHAPLCLLLLFCCLVGSWSGRKARTSHLMAFPPLPLGAAPNVPARPSHLITSPEGRSPTPCVPSSAQRQKGRREARRRHQIGLLPPPAEMLGTRRCIVSSSRGGDPVYCRVGHGEGADYM